MHPDATPTGTGADGGRHAFAPQEARTNQDARVPNDSRVVVRLVEGAVGHEPPMAVDGTCGALVEFRGMVRVEEDGGRLAALRYSAYRPMAERELARLAEGILRAHGLGAVQVVHSTGRVAVGECSFLLRMAAAHRAEALSAMAEFIDLMKRDVPLWKAPEWATPPP